MPAKKYQLAVYRAEALKKPFELIVDDKTTVSIPVPDTETVLQVTETTVVREQLRLLTGDQYGALMEALGDQPGGVLKLLMKDLTEHFDLGE
jgi:hypothetical protein